MGKGQRVVEVHAAAGHAVKPAAVAQRVGHGAGVGGLHARGLAGLLVVEEAEHGHGAVEGRLLGGDLLHQEVKDVLVDLAADAQADAVDAVAQLHVDGRDNGAVGLHEVLGDLGLVKEDGAGLVVAHVFGGLGDLGHGELALAPVVLREQGVLLGAREGAAVEGVHVRLGSLGLGRGLGGHGLPRHGGGSGGGQPSGSGGTGNAHEATPGQVFHGSSLLPF